ncbi:cytochrome d ubiquinol oxidase subunit II [Tessaracoccus antarcticus]|uniref:Cytochrome d ubiquinol oxidase subunit II n=1 Tax=Tessaracoccus antarcticus TaxID=2479848 RepID=A0A3M0G9W0_9ACTN|nr:cytochrome d ubiquinol oxidase subunit II [Tessaracoccus antarcticus]RMB61674.1 cytochrome d ubiquinol oxidase subunit II [Tessaracoccus antarcticus]
MMLLETVPTLAIVWYMLIVVLWLGFFFLEGFDFGVGMLMPILGRTEKKRRVLINTIGPVWDGNEVWLLTAGGAMFAAFPGWYASLFSALYLPLLLMLVGLILRGVAFEYRAKRPDAAWRTMLDRFAIVGSFLPTLVLGVGFANFVIGLPNDGLLFNGTLLGLFNPFALLGGVMLLALFLNHGATFITLKTAGPIHDNARKLVGTIGWAAVALVAGFVVIQNIVWPAASNFGDFTVFGWVAAILAVATLAGSVMMTSRGREGWGFVLNGVAILALFGGIFLRMYGNLGFAQNAGVAVADHLNIITAASSPTTLTIMTWAAVIFVPIVIAYQAWSYWVFRKRISTKNIPDEVEAVA